jgi:hypothetical protein
MLEMSAEATRNPQVATMLIEAESRMFANACAPEKAVSPPERRAYPLLRGDYRRDDRRNTVD